MSYAIEESSVDHGAPLEIYDLVLGTEEWHFTSTSEERIVDGVTYTPIAVKRDSVPVAIDERTNESSITLPSSHPFVQKYITLVPKDLAVVTIRRFHRFDLSDEVVKIFKGVVSAVSFSDNGGLATVGLTPFTTRLSLAVPRYVYSGLCNHVLGDRWCTINLETGNAADIGLPFKYVGNVSLIDNIHVRVDGIGAAGYPNNFFKSGVIITAAGDKRLITNQNVDTLRVLVPLFEGTSLLGHNVSVYAGCDHNPLTGNGCKLRFNNMVNYGGFPYVPRNNPFSTGLK